MWERTNSLENDVPENNDLNVQEINHKKQGNLGNSTSDHKYNEIFYQKTKLET